VITEARHESRATTSTFLPRAERDAYLLGYEDANSFSAPSSSGKARPRRMRAQLVAPGALAAN